MSTSESMVDAELSISEDLIRNALDGIPTPLDFVYVSLGVPEGSEAWRVVLEAARRGFRGEPPPFGIEEIAAAVDRVGWREICRANDLERVRQVFLRTYLTYVARRAADEYAVGDLEIPSAEPVRGAA